MARSKRLRTDVIESPLGFRIHVLHYEDGAIGIRIGQRPMVVEQAFLTDRPTATCPVLDQEGRMTQITRAAVLPHVSHVRSSVDPSEFGVAAVLERERFAQHLDRLRTRSADLIARRASEVAT